MRPEPDRWVGYPVVCVASGPSLTGADCALVRAAREADRCRVIIVNSSCAEPLIASHVLWPVADVLFASDWAWWAHYDRQVAKRKWPAFAGEKWSVAQAAGARCGVNVVHGYAGPGLSRKPGKVHTGGNSGYAAMGLGIDFGGKPVVLLGYDMQRTGGRSHNHGDHPRPLTNGNNLPACVRRYNAAAKDAQAMGVEIVNASRATALTCFPRVELAKALQLEQV